MQIADIQCLLKKAGISQSDLARQLNVSKVTVGYVLAGITTSRRVALAIAQVTGRTLEELWPGKYPQEETV